MYSSHRASTYIRLGPIEAYAASSMRRMSLIGTGATLTLSAEGDLQRQALRVLREGAAVSPAELEQTVPGLPDRQWTFVDDRATDQFQLRTQTEGIDVVLSWPRSAFDSAGDAQAQLRGQAARLATTMAYPPIDSEMPPDDRGGA